MKTAENVQELCRGGEIDTVQVLARNDTLLIPESWNRSVKEKFYMLETANLTLIDETEVTENMSRIQRHEWIIASNWFSRQDELDGIEDLEVGGTSVIHGKALHDRYLGEGYRTAGGVYDAGCVLQNGKPVMKMSCEDLESYTIISFSPDSSEGERNGMKDALFYSLLAVLALLVLAGAAAILYEVRARDE